MRKLGKKNWAMAQKYLAGGEKTLKSKVGHGPLFWPAGPVLKCPQTRMVDTFGPETHFYTTKNFTQGKNSIYKVFVPKLQNRAFSKKGAKECFT